jgi:hypothetical protein
VNMTNAPIHVNIIMIINIILHHCALIDSHENRWGAYSIEKGKRGGGEYFNNISKKLLWICFYPKF